MVGTKGSTNVLVVDVAGARLLIHINEYGLHICISLSGCRCFAQLTSTYLYQRKKTSVSMGSPMSSGKLICQQKKCRRSSLSLPWVLILQGMACRKRTGYLWLLCTAMLGYLLWLSILVPDLALTKLTGTSMILVVEKRVAFFFLFCSLSEGNFDAENVCLIWLMTFLPYLKSLLELQRNSQRRSHLFQIAATNPSQAQKGG